ncbi:family 78 glycoside hydrolase catalytic domain [Paenarthrobacter nicotinovorans]|uniref:alpha-L-rhamnosidase n=1 Tax=Paenarthrobacter nicotinovorans TaxID=29320 RepID=UPI003749A0EC
MTSWNASFIAPDSEFDGSPRLRQEFTLDTGHGDVLQATLLLSALGIVEAWVNGSPVSEDVLVPGWTSYEWRVRYAQYDVTELLGDTTVIGIALGNGWYRGRLGWLEMSNVYGKELGAFAELRVTFRDGHEQRLGTDSSWRAGPSPTTRNDFYDGQDVDARRYDDSWLLPGFESKNWVSVHPLDMDLGKLEPYVGPPVRRQEQISPVEVWTSPEGKLLVDFGQNLVGWVRAEVKGPAGSTVTLRHAEVLDGGELGTRPLRTALATDRFTLSGGADVFEPTQTFHGFRYIEVDGWPGGEESLRHTGGLTAVVIHSEMRRIGQFRSSNELLNKLHQNAVWGMKGNFIDLPTDCPQRDERLGWTGDIAAFAPSAAFLYDVKDFLRDWLRDLAIEQSHQNGIVPIIVPDIIKYFPEDAGLPPVEASAVWGDAAVWVPWTLWTAYGDSTILADQFDSMAAHARRVRSLLSPTGLWDTGFQFGDWLDPDAPPESPHEAKASPYVVATICAFRTAVIVADTAALLGDARASAEFRDMAERIRDGFTQHYLKDGVIESDAATVYALAIMFDLLSDADRESAGNRLAQLVAESGFRISTGFAGTPFVTDALTTTGHLDVAYRLLLQTENPSWLYSVTMGATTIWERWNSLLPDGTINPGGMTSFNHYALGAVVDWIHRTVGGLSPIEPGYGRVLVAPQPGGDITWAETRLHTPHGEASVYWEMDEELLRITTTVPREAVLRLPGRDDEIVPAGSYERVVPITPMASFSGSPQPRLTPGGGQRAQNHEL